MLDLLPLLLLLVLTTSPWPPTASGQDSSATVSPLNIHCNTTAAGNSTAASSAYLSNLRALGDALSRRAFSGAGFASGSYGTAPDEVHGLALCRGDFTGGNCTDGLASAFRDAAAQFCPNAADATVYYDQYMIRYTGDGRLLSDLRNNEPLWSGKNMNEVAGTGAAARFMDKATELMNKAADLAAFGPSSSSTPSRYATGETWFDEQGVSIVYGLVQCTPDLTGEQCRSCLAGIVAQMPKLFGSASSRPVGGRILGVRCNLRYEKDVFFKETNATLKLNMPKKGMSTMLMIFGVPCLVLIISVVLLRPHIVRQIRELLLQRDLVVLEREIVSESDERFSLFKFSKIKSATGNFSEQNKLGEGGFGPVYKGRLTTNQDIAVKRLSPNSIQGFKEFKNEIKLIACLRHRNLVRLLGCCIKSKERILVYEYMPNGSLDDLIFGEEAKPNWPVRRHIIEGVAEGLLYIHDYAHERIVHRDLKPSNILLDHEMNPKISDFGIAKICLPNVIESKTTTAMGTFGYIAPEYYSQSVYSTRSDVFSFGILVLEIISGKRAVGSYKLSGRSFELRRYAWQLWKEERCDELVDPSLGEDYQEMDIIRCIQAALLCVQDSAEDRPTMHDVTTMLSNRNRRLLVPAQPGSFNIDIGDSEEI
ncbi:cysteine-rich receptor-like protein kinase 15 [Oryza brachyantha]|uniref:non-specific serine/threonine protein kinase n=1 Tax=Oryza brachyantha TaxID=4533 RepID=J3KZJ6_ORYBR|nr:cysteine-rich receptor-like protein kinase 15 [Oryza brachyantha]